jgi:polyisoprenoid-binding protein YceI
MAPSGQLTSSSLQTFLQDGTLAGDNHPDIIFTADGAAPSGDAVTVTGALTVRDRSRPVSFPVTVSAPGSGEVWLDAELPINRADFGLTWSQLGMASMSNTITVHAVFRRR